MAIECPYAYESAEEAGEMADYINALFASKGLAPVVEVQGAEESTEQKGQIDCFLLVEIPGPTIH